MAADAPRQGTVQGPTAGVGARADMPGCAKVHWVTNPDNGTTMTLYKRLATQTHSVRFEKIIAA